MMLSQTPAAFLAKTKYKTNYLKRMKMDISQKHSQFKKMTSALDTLIKRRSLAMEMGGEKKVQKHHEKGKKTARERIDILLDEGTFREYGILATHKNANSNDLITPCDGVVTGFGKIHGRPVGLISEDATVYGGSIGHINMEKRIRMIDIAQAERVPLVFLLDGAGARAQMAADSSEGLVMVYHFIKMAKLSGLVPTVSVVLGGCGGEPALEAPLMEFCIMVKNQGMLAAGGPPVVLTSLGLKVTSEELGGADVHCTISGVADNPANDEEEALIMVKEYLSYLPTNAWQYPPHLPSGDDPNRREERLLTILPENSKAPFDMKRIIEWIVDKNSFFEIKPCFAPMLIIGFARMDGHPVGIIANQPLHYSGAITASAAKKERHFIDLCSAYHIPLVFLQDVPGVMTGPESEREGALRYGVAVAHSLAWADVPKITVVIRRSFGFGGCAMCGKGAGQVITLGWPTVNFGGLPAESGIQAAHGKELLASPDPYQRKTELLGKYGAGFDVLAGAGQFTIDDVIDPRETRPRIIEALELALNRRSKNAEPVMRHGVMP